MPRRDRDGADHARLPLHLRQIHGGAGYIADYGIERLYRDVRLFRLYEGTSQIRQIIIARETLKRGG